jgi:hypothetical protein
MTCRNSLRLAIVILGAALAFMSGPACADSGPAIYDVNGNATFVSQGTTETIDYTFQVDYAYEPGTTDLYSYATGMAFSSSGPFTITSWSDQITEDEFLAFYDSAGDEFDLKLSAFYPYMPSLWGADVWGCQSASCQSLYNDTGTGEATGLQYPGTADPEVTVVTTPEPSILTTLFLALSAWQIFVNFRNAFKNRMAHDRRP